MQDSLSLIPAFSLSLKDTVEINQKTTQMGLSKNYLFSARESVNITGMWQRLKGGQKGGNAL